MGKEVSKTLAKTKGQFKEGDWVVSPGKVYRKIMAVLDTGMGPSYAVFSPRDPDHLHWETQYELDEDKVVVKEPEFERFANIKPGDIMRIGNREEDPYVVILQRIGMAVLLSNVPDKKLVAKLMEVDKALRTMTDIDEKDSILDSEEFKHVKKLSSQLHSSKIAGDWMDIRQIALMNWEMIEE